MTKQFDPLEALNLRYLVFPGPDTALRGLEQYLAAVDEQLSYLKGQYKVRFKAQLKRGAHGKDPEDIYLAKYNVDYLNGRTLSTIHSRGLSHLPMGSTRIFFDRYG